MGGAQAALVASCKLQQNANEGCNSCVNLAGFIACFIVVVGLMGVLGLARTVGDCQSTAFPKQ